MMLNHKRKSLTPLKDVLVENSNYNRSRMKVRLVEEGILDYICDKCSNSGTWLGGELVLQLEHKNGISTDNRINNLCFLCPNCHTQTSTYAGRNTKHRKSVAIKEKQTKRDDFINHRVDMIVSSGINFSKHGWVSKVSELISISPQKVTPWMIMHMSDFYQDMCYKRNPVNQL